MEKPTSTAPDGAERDPGVSPTRVSTPAPVNFRRRVKSLVARAFLRYLYDRLYWRIVARAQNGESRAVRRDEFDDLAERFGKETEAR